MKTTLGMILVLLSVCAPAQTNVGRRAVASSAFQQLAELTGSQSYALASTSIALSGDTLLIGVPGTNSGEGAAYVYTASNGDWANLALTATLTQSRGQSVGGFGDAVAISGDTIVVGGYDADAGAGAAYVYISPSGTVAEDAELTIAGAGTGPIFSVGIDGRTIVLGDPAVLLNNGAGIGAAYVYVEPSGGWANMTQTAVLVANDETTNCYFGNSVGVSANTVVVGAPRCNANELEERGCAYVFVEPTKGWSGTRGQTAELDPSDGTKRAYFGQSVSISDGNVVVGAPQQTIGSNGTQGAAYVYTRPSNGWPKTMTETAELMAVDGKAGSELGYSVAISGGTLLAGAADVHNRRGVVYVFSERSGGWETMSGGAAIAAPDTAPNNIFGAAVAIGGGVLAASAPDWPSGTGGDGAVYVFGQTQ